MKGFFIGILLMHMICFSGEDVAAETPFVGAFYEALVDHCPYRFTRATVVATASEAALVRLAKNQGIVGAIARSAKQSPFVHGALLALAQIGDMYMDGEFEPNHDPEQTLAQKAFTRIVAVGTLKALSYIVRSEQK